MLRKTTAEWVRRFNEVMAGCGRCRGIFRIIDGEGTPLGGVEVQFRVGDSEWTPCGRSRKALRKVINYNQPSTVYYPIGEPVAWHFFKPGYIETTVTRYCADTTFDENMDTVMLRRSDFAQWE